MKKTLTIEDGIECVFKDKNNNEITCTIPEYKLRELIEEYAYEIITTPDCNDSTCALNGFCECEMINEDAELDYLNVYVC